MLLYRLDGIVRDMSKQKISSATRQTIVEAACRVILTNGVANLTLEAVAKEAGVSKGGLLYHFPSKEALVQGLVEKLDQDFSDEVDRQAAQEKNSGKAGSWLRAYVRASVTTDQPSYDISAGLLAAFATNPAMLEVFRESFGRWQNQAEQDGIDPALATIIRLAADGLWLADLFGFAPPSGALREAVLAKLFELSGEDKK